MSKFLVLGLLVFMHYRSGFKARIVEWDGNELTLKKWCARTSRRPGFYEPFEVGEFYGPTATAWRLVEDRLVGIESFTFRMRK